MDEMLRALGFRLVPSTEVERVESSILLNVVEPSLRFREEQRRMAEANKRLPLQIEGIERAKTVSPELLRRRIAV